MRLFDTSSTVTGMDSPSSVKMRVMPTLRPTRPSRCAAGVGVEFDIVFSIPDCDWSGLIRRKVKAFTLQGQVTKTACFTTALLLLALACGQGCCCHKMASFAY